LSSHQFTSPVSVAYGVGARSQLTSAVAEFEAERVLLVTDPRVAAAGVAQAVSSLLPAGLDVVVFDGVVCEPTDTSIMEGVRAYAKHRPDVVIGVGGGSSMDSAKAIRAVSEAGGDVKSREGFNRFPTGVVPKSRLVCIATTAGTGSEMGCWSMVIDTDRRYKMALADSNMLMPDMSIVDPELDVTVPPDTTARTGMDALSHAIETYVAGNHSPVTDALSLHAIRFVGKSLARACADGEDILARADMAYAAMIAGVSINNVDCGAVHALGETVGPLYDLSHGLAMAAFMPYVMKLNAAAVPDRMQAIAQALGADVERSSPAKASEEAWRAVARLAGDIGIPCPSSFGIDQSTLGELATRSLGNPSSDGNPMPLDETAYVELLDECLSVDLW